MFFEFTRLLSKLNSKPIQMMVLSALAVVIAAVLLGSLVRWLRRRRQDSPESAAGLLVESILSVGTVLKVIVGLGIVAAVCLHLKSQSGEFIRQRGGTSQRNYDAVKTIWGVPHIQSELGVRLVTYATHYYDKDGLELDAEKLKATTMPVGYRKSEVEVVVPGDPILEADHNIVLAMNYRKKGTAWYPGFETDCAFKYRIANVSDKAVTGVFSFPLPAGQGLVDKVRVTVDGKDIDRGVVLQGETLTWKQPLAAGEEHAVAVSYYSRGLEYIRFEPGAGRTLRRYVIHMLLKDMQPGQLSNPIGCMAPTSSVAQGPDTLLEWKLDNAFTRLGLGAILPAKTQEGYYFGKILAAAPWGLILMLAMVLVTFLVVGEPVAWIPLAVLALGYHLNYLLAAHLADYPVGLNGGMIIAAVVLTALMALMQWAWVGRFTAAATLAFFVLFIAGYPLLRISDHEGLLLTILYVALLAYVVALLVWKRRRAS